MPLGAQFPADTNSAPRMPALEVRGLTKRYAGTVALNGVSFDIDAGGVHAFVGENGAGKSTLSKILAGVERPDGGDVIFTGMPVKYRSPREALDQGIAMVHQEISLVPVLSVIENVFLGIRSKDGAAGRRARFDALLAESGFDLNPRTRVSDLPLAEQQKVEIVRALAYDAKVVIFDEPTAALTLREAEQLHAAIRRLRDRGKTIIYVSHFLDEVLDLADTVTILKDGHHVRTNSASLETVATLINGMLGRDLDSVFPPKRDVAADAPIALSIEGFSKQGVIDDASFDVRSGEIVGIAGLVGSGRTELARLIFGRDRRDSGVLRLNGEELRLRSTAEAIKAGIIYLSEDRKDQGLLLNRPVFENLTLASLPFLNPFGVIRPRAERRLAQRVAEQIELRPVQLDQPAGSYSGGNQQKVVFGRCLIREPKVVIADEPTRGVDVGARAAMYQLLDDFARRGIAVIIISSDLEEVQGMADRILVMHQGRIAATLPGDATEESILAVAFGEVSEGTHK